MQPTDPQLASAAKALAAGRPEEAERLLREVLAADPRSLHALMALAGLLLALGRLAEAAELAERAIRLNPGLGPPHFHLGQCLLRQSRFEEAAEELEIAARISPNIASIQHVLGLALSGAGRAQLAEGHFRRAIALDPAAAPAYAELGQLLMAKGDQEGAIESFRRAAELQPNSARGQFLLGRALIESEKFAEGEVHLRKATQADPAFADAYVLLARAQQQQGRFAEADAILRQLGARTEDEIQGFYLRVTNRPVTEQDRPMLERVERSADSLEPGARRSVAYGLGKAFDDLGEFERAMRHFDVANRLSQERLNSLGRVFDADALSRYVDKAISRWSARDLRDARTGGDPSEKPVFIVGMARSGTTLLEQIVSSHPDARAAGELGTWTALHSTEFDARREAAELLAKLDALAPDAARVTIKTPQNYLIVGPILAVFPNCRIVHCRRNPIDTCLSIYATSFMSGPEFAHDRASLAAAYRQYLRIMEHWREIVPPDRLMDVDYERIVTDREPILRAVLAFLGLEWDAAVMHHEANEHAISTPSLWQARQPIFDRSVGRWRHYEPWLGPILELNNLT